MNLPQRARREDRRRELALWILLSAAATRLPPTEAAKRFERSFVVAPETPTSLEATEFFALERINDHLPSPEDWQALREGVIETVTIVELNLAKLDETIRAASPKWRIDRMPLVDRSLLRIGVAELLFTESPRPRATFNGLIELAKRYGEQNSPKFINGILDQIRRNLDIPFQ